MSDEGFLKLAAKIYDNIDESHLSGQYGHYYVEGWPTVSKESDGTLDFDRNDEGILYLAHTLKESNNLKPVFRPDYFDSPSLAAEQVVKDLVNTGSLSHIGSLYDREDEDGAETAEETNTAELLRILQNYGVISGEHYWALLAALVKNHRNQLDTSLDNKYLDLTEKSKNAGDNRGE